MKVGERFGKKVYIEKQNREKFRIAIIYQVASYWPTIESFYKACVDDKAVEVRIFYVDEESVETVQVKDSGAFLEMLGIGYTFYSEEALREFMPHVALYQPPYDVSYRNYSALSLHLKNMGIRIVYIPYGIEIADTEDARYNHFCTYVIRNCWRIYTFSEKMLEDYIQYCPNRDAVRVFGIPKFDSIYEKRAELDSYIKCKVKEKRVILWKMHFPKLIYEGNIRKQVTPYLLHYIKFAEVIEQYKDVFFVVMPHPLFFSHTIDPILAKESGELFDILKEKPNVIIDMDSDYRKTLYNADAIIVDRSALMVEAGLCGVPVLYMKNVDYEEPLTKAVEGLVNAYEHGINTDDMNNFVKKFQAGELCVETQKILAVKEREFGYVDGKCGERILSDIKNGIIEAENPRIKVVFFGASFICDHYLKKLDIMNNIHFEVIALSDNNMEKWGAARNGIAVIPPEKLKYISFDILVITSEQYYLPIKKKLVYELYIEEEKVLRLDRFVEKYFESREEE